MKRLHSVTALAALTFSASALAMGSSGSSAKRAEQIEANKAQCAEIAQTGLKEWKQVDWSKFKAPSNDLKKYPIEMPVVFHVINHTGKGFFGGFKIKEREIAIQLQNINETYGQCGIVATAAEVHYWTAPEFLNVLGRNAEDTQRLGWEERCLFKAVHRPRQINVYFVDGVYDPNGNGRSHAIAEYWFQPEEAHDYDYIGAAIIADADRAGGGVRWTVTPHEVGHALMNESHMFGGQYNIMADSRELLGPAVTPAQCEKARNNIFVRRR